MSLIQRLAEEKICAAIERGELDNLPGRGKPLVLDDNQGVPEELRAAYRILKNSGYLPPDLVIRREITEVEGLLLCVDNDAQQKRLMARLNLLRSRLARESGESHLLIQEGAYRDKLVARMARKVDSNAS